MSMTAHPEAGPAPRWAVVTTGILVIFGLGISTYRTIAHYLGTHALACSANSVVDCALVTTSKQSVVLGIPVAVLGLAFFLAALPIYSPWAWRSKDRRIHVARLAMVSIGMVFVLWLIAAELLIIEKICLWCTAVHVVTFVLFAITIRTVPAMLAGEDA